MFFALSVAKASAESENCPASLVSLAPKTNAGATFSYYLLALSPRTVDTTVVAETNAGWFTWTLKGVPLQSAAFRISTATLVKGAFVFAASPLLSTTFSKPVQVDRVWVTRASASGDTVFGWDASGKIACDIPDFSDSFFPPGVEIGELVMPKGQVPATSPPAAPAIPSVAPFPPPTCAKPFVEASLLKAVTPNFPEALGQSIGKPYRSEALAKVALDENGNVTDVWIVEATSIKEFDQAVVDAARKSSYSPAASYCQNVKGYYYFRAYYRY